MLILTKLEDNFNITNIVELMKQYYIYHCIIIFPFEGLSIFLMVVLTFAIQSTTIELYILKDNICHTY